MFFACEYQSCFVTNLKLLKPVDTMEVSKGKANGITYCKDEQKYKMQICAFLDKCWISVGM